MLRGLTDWLSVGERDDYECRQCGAVFAHRRQVCPHCGGGCIDRVDWEDVASRD